MPSKKTQPSSQRTTPTSTTTTPTEGQPPRRSNHSAQEDYVNVWLGFAKEVGETTSDFVRRFGDEQQKNYEQWASTLRNQAKPRPTTEDLNDARTRFEAWNQVAQEIGAKVSEAFTSVQDLQKNFFENWSRSGAGEKATPADQAREYAELVQRFWTGLSKEIYERANTTIPGQPKFDEFVRSQEESLKDFAENFRKLTYSYFTSPPFVTLFGKTLDASLDLQRQLKEAGNAFPSLTTLPSKKDLAQIQQTLSELADKVHRIEEKIR